MKKAFITGITGPHTLRYPATIVPPYGADRADKTDPILPNSSLIKAMRYLASSNFSIRIEAPGLPLEYERSLGSMANGYYRLSRYLWSAGSTAP